MCHICLSDRETEKLDRLDVCSECMVKIKEKVMEYEEKARTTE